MTSQKLSPQDQLKALNCTIDDYIEVIVQDLLADVSSSTTILTRISHHYMKRPSKRLRPRLILLMSLATNGVPCQNEYNSAALTIHNDHVDNVQKLEKVPDILPEQSRLAEIIEMIHVGSLLHDDVIDESPLRRGVLSAPKVFGNKRTILAGDYLLGRSISLSASLGNPRVVSLVASIISNLIEGEIRQADDSLLSFEQLALQDVDTYWDSYISKTFMKTASLFSHSLKACILLSGIEESSPLVEMAATYGKDLGMAFQIMDDILDFDVSGLDAGKPVGAEDVKLGLVTAPLYFALQQERSTLIPLLTSSMDDPDTLAQIVTIVRRTDAIERSHTLAKAYADNAREVLSLIPSSVAKSCLEALTYQVVSCPI
ncbi:isoprenoid synthase domain-containing protein [Mycena floridula]|nr:isoprenoid synthase domain-containing protein [Mycena floridula]